MTDMTASKTLPADPWAAVRAEFDLTAEYVHLGPSQFVASHSMERSPKRTRANSYRRPASARGRRDGTAQMWGGIIS